MAKPSKFDDFTNKVVEFRGDSSNFKMLIVNKSLALTADGVLPINYTIRELVNRTIKLIKPADIANWQNGEGTVEWQAISAADVVNAHFDHNYVKNVKTYETLEEAKQAISQDIIKCSNKCNERGISFYKPFKAYEDNYYLSYETFSGDGETIDVKTKFGYRLGNGVHKSMEVLGTLYFDKETMEAIRDNINKLILGVVVTPHNEKPLTKTRTKKPAKVVTVDEVNDFKN